MNTQTTFNAIHTEYWQRTLCKCRSGMRALGFYMSANGTISASTKHFVSSCWAAWWSNLAKGDRLVSGLRRATLLSLDHRHHTVELTTVVISKLVYITVCCIMTRQVRLKLRYSRNAAAAATGGPSI